MRLEKRKKFRDFVSHFKEVKPSPLVLPSNLTCNFWGKRQEGHIPYHLIDVKIFLTVNSVAPVQYFYPPNHLKRELTYLL